MQPSECQRIHQTKKPQQKVAILQKISLDSMLFSSHAVIMVTNFNRKNPLQEEQTYDRNEGRLT